VSTAGRRLFLHVGAPKTGTTFLQDVLWHGRETWPQHGVTYPLTAPDEHFPAAVDLLDLRWGGRPRPEWSGRWATLAERARQAEGDVVLSDELLAAATPAQVAEVVAAFPDHERHLVLTLRSVTAMLTSDWQEQVKHRHAADWPSYLADVFDRPEESHFGRWFHEHHDVASVLDRWAPFAEGERVHVVVNESSADPASLWRTFAGVAGLPAGAGLPAHDADAVNASLGLDATSALARVNGLVADLPDEAYGETVGRLLIGRALPAAFARTKVRLPAERLPAVRDLEARTVERISDGYDVVGDTSTLLGADGAAAPDDVLPQDGPFAEVVAALVRELAEREDRIAAWERLEEIRRRRWWRRLIAAIR